MKSLQEDSFQTEKSYSNRKKEAEDTVKSYLMHEDEKVENESYCSNPVQKT